MPQKATYRFLELAERDQSSSILYAPLCLRRSEKLMRSNERRRHRDTSSPTRCYFQDIKAFAISCMKNGDSGADPGVQVRRWKTQKNQRLCPWRNNSLLNPKLAVSHNRQVCTSDEYKYAFTIPKDLYRRNRVYTDRTEVPLIQSAVRLPNSFNRPYKTCCWLRLQSIYLHRSPKTGFLHPHELDTPDLALAGPYKTCFQL